MTLEKEKYVTSLIGPCPESELAQSQITLGAIAMCQILKFPTLIDKVRYLLANGKFVARHRSAVVNFFFLSETHLICATLHYSGHQGRSAKSRIVKMYTASSWVCSRKLGCEEWSYLSKRWQRQAWEAMRSDRRTSRRTFERQRFHSKSPNLTSLFLTNLLL